MNHTPHHLAGLGLNALVLGALIACAPLPQTSSASKLSDGALTQDRAQALDHLLRDYLIYSGEPGVALAVHIGEHSYRGAAGFSNLETGQAMSPETQFRTGSGTKLFLITLVMMLHERGLIDIDDPLGFYVEQFPQWSTITLRQLASMQSGIPDYLLDKPLWAAVTLHPRKERSPESLLDFIRNKDLTAPPGTRCDYSNSNFLLLGMVLEKATGLRIEELIQSWLAEPLDLDRTMYDMLGEPLSGLAHGYTRVDSVGDAFGLPRFLSPILFPMRRINGLADMTYRFHPSISGTAGALISTPVDLARFVDRLLGGKVLAPASLEAMKETHTCNILGQRYDYGMGLVRLPSPVGDLVGHSSLSYGYRTRSFHAETEDLSFSLMTNRVPDQGDALQDELIRTLEPTSPAPRETACPLPEGFAAPPTGDYLRLRFRGRINKDPGAAIALGIGAGEIRLGHRVYPLDGAEFLAQQSGARVAIHSRKTPHYEGVRGKDLRISVHLGFAPLEEAMKRREGLYEFKGRDEAAPIILVKDFTTIGDTTRACVKAVAHSQTRSTVNICDAPKSSALFTEGPSQTQSLDSPAALVKLFGKFYLETRQKIVRDYLASKAIQLCECYTQDGPSYPCDP